MQHKSPLALHRSADQHRLFRRLIGMVDAELGHHLAYGEVLGRIIDRDAQGVIRPVHAQKDHRPLKAFVAYAGHGDQQAAGQGVAQRRGYIFERRGGGAHSR